MKKHTIWMDFTVLGRLMAYKKEKGVAVSESIRRGVEMFLKSVGY